MTEPIDYGYVRVRFALLGVSRFSVLDEALSWPSIVAEPSYAVLKIAPLGFLTDPTSPQGNHI